MSLYIMSALFLLSGIYVTVSDLIQINRKGG